MESHAALETRAKLINSHQEIREFCRAEHATPTKVRLKALKGNDILRCSS